MKDLKKLFKHTLKNVYYAENHTFKALSRFAEIAQSPELRMAFKTHLVQTRGHVKRLDQIFGLLGEPAKGVKCQAIKGILKEGEDVIANFGDETVLDAVIIAVAQTVGHYEIARYRALKTWAEQLNWTETAGLLEETLREERSSDKLLIKLAETNIDLLAA